MSQDLEARLAKLDTEKVQYAEQVTSLTEQLSQAKQEAELANRLLEESRTQMEQMKKHQHAENVNVILWSRTTLSVVACEGLLGLGALSILIHVGMCKGRAVIC